MYFLFEKRSDDEDLSLRVYKYLPFDIVYDLLCTLDQLVLTSFLWMEYIEWCTILVSDTKIRLNAMFPLQNASEKLRCFLNDSIYTETED